MVSRNLAQFLAEPPGDRVHQTIGRRSDQQGAQTLFFFISLERGKQKRLLFTEEENPSQDTALILCIEENGKEADVRSFENMRRF
ncbi:hypothetical protein CEXT_694751 [Caerostris extrusa]|uniref:Uncharacterized protein n=1 Tax=Caerostris extrusa TaxID=172846 RepID=A0AAV4QCE0_CAEEX|nr:hypothetical protein CEXT_694751 [Caerostris extrusa]